NSFFIDSPGMALPLIEAIAKTGKVLAFHIGTDAYEATHPFRLAKIAEQFPETQILMIHIGGVGFADVSSAAIEVIAGHPNVTGIGSNLRHINVLKAIKQLGADRVCFGSDYPFNLMHVEVAAYQALMDGECSAEEQAMIWAGNISRVLQLESSPA
ncbi:MAG: amidohydrolase, partial [Anaerolineae bacterium]|nr:amidohydrolase [Anaerolineae bacterium]